MTERLKSFNSRSLTGALLRPEDDTVKEKQYLAVFPFDSEEKIFFLRSYFSLMLFNKTLFLFFNFLKDPRKSLLQQLVPIRHTVGKVPEKVSEAGIVEFLPPGSSRAFHVFCHILPPGHTQKFFYDLSATEPQIDEKIFRRNADAGFFKEPGKGSHMFSKRCRKLFVCKKKLYILFQITCGNAASGDAGVLVFLKKVFSFLVEIQHLSSSLLKDHHIFNIPPFP